uniref:Uncharacterized protein n=1 Tax=Eutreptiella gymnastica TaxID=73025 RepID=A0A7S4GCR4_9EUGL
MSFSIKRLFSGSFSTDPTDDHSVSRADGAAENDSFGTQEALSFDTATPHATAALASIKPLDLRALGSATTTDSEPPLHRSPPSSGPNGDSEDDAGNAAELQAKLREARQQVADLQILREETAAKLAAAEARSREAEAAFERMSSGALSPRSLLLVSPRTGSSEGLPEGDSAISPRVSSETWDGETDVLRHKLQTATRLCKGLKVKTALLEEQVESLKALQEQSYALETDMKRQLEAARQELQTEREQWAQDRAKLLETVEQLRGESAEASCSIWSLFTPRTPGKQECF